MRRYIDLIERTDRRRTLRETRVKAYHGTFKKFDRFEPGHSNGMTNSRRGFYFTDDPEAAAEFGNVSSYYLDLRHPANFLNGEGQDFVDRALATNPALRDKYTAAVENKYGPPVTPNRLGNMGLLQTDEFIVALQTIGCDSMIMEDNFSGFDFVSYVVFSPEQITRVSKQPLRPATSHI